MDFSGRLMELRKNRGWTQEYLADKMSISENTLVRWESGISFPDSEMMSLLAKIFDVNIEYLEKGEESGLDEKGNTVSRFFSYDEAMEYREVLRKSVHLIAIATGFLILSPSVLILLSSFNESGIIVLPIDISRLIGYVALAVFILIALVLYTIGFSRTKKYSFLGSNSFEIESSLKITLEDLKEEYRPSFRRKNIIAVLLAVSSFFPMIIAAIFSNSEVVGMITFVLMLFIIEVAIYIFMLNIMNWLFFNILLKDEAYLREKKAYERRDPMPTGGELYWGLTFTIFLMYSFYTKNWAYSWIILLVAFILFYVYKKIRYFLRK